MASAIACYSFEPTTDGEAYNLGNPEPVTMRELAQRIYEVAGKLGVIPANKALRFVSQPAYADDVRLRIPSFEKAKKDLGWSPTVSLNRALQVCVSAAVNTTA